MFKCQEQDYEEPQHIGGSSSLSKVTIALYIKLGVGQIINYGIEIICLVCYPIFAKKETSGKEVE